MRKIFFTIISFLIIGNTFATIRRVNNNSGVIAVNGLIYTTIEPALNDAVNGDTIYVEPSITPYFPSTGSVTFNLTKRLVFIGNGYQIASNATLISPLPYQTNESILGNQNLIFNVNTGAENSVFIGITFNTNNLTVNSGSTVWRRCKFKNNISLISANNFLEQSLFSNINTSLIGNASSINNTFKNCIIQTTYGQNSSVFDNCYINSINNFSPFIQNCTFTNCIINIFANIPDQNNTFSHCLKVGSAFPVASINNNLENIAMANIFTVVNPLITLNNEVLDKNFRLKPATSPALAAGILGVDMGAFGGSNPYRLSGQPAIPIITNFFLSTTGSTASGLSGSITIQSNN